MIALSAFLKVLKYTVYVFACMFGALWCPFLLPLLEPRWSGGLRCICFRYVPQ